MVKHIGGWYTALEVRTYCVSYVSICIMCMQGRGMKGCSCMLLAPRIGKHIGRWDAALEVYLYVSVTVHEPTTRTPPPPPTPKHKQFTGAVAVLTNCLLMVLVSQELGPLVPPALRFLLDSNLGAFIHMHTCGGLEQQIVPYSISTLSPTPTISVHTHTNSQPHNTYTNTQAASSSPSSSSTF